MKRQHFTAQIALIVFAALILAALPLRAETSAAAPSLYDRLGGVYAIAAVVDDFIERLLVNKTLNANPSISEARMHVPKQGLKYHVTAFVCHATGGPCVYTGRDMKPAHAHLNITEKEWRAMVADFRRTLDKFKVPKKEQDELVLLVGTTKPDIVVANKM